MTTALSVKYRNRGKWGVAKHMKRKALLRLCAFCWLVALYQIGHAQPEIVVRSGHSSPIKTMVPSPDGKVLASVDEKGLIIIWDIASTQELRAFSAPSAWSGSIAFSPDSEMIAYGYSQGIKLWNVISGKELESFSEDKIDVKDTEDHEDTENLITGIAYSPDGKSIVSVNTVGDIALWDIASGKKHILLESDCLVSAGTGLGAVYYPRSIAFSPDGKSVAFYDCSSKGTKGEEDREIGLALLDTKTGQRIKSLEKSFGDYNQRSIAFSPNGELLVSTTAVDAQNDTTVDETTVWSVASGKVRASFLGDGPVFSTDSLMVTTHKESVVSLWNISSKQKLETFPGQVSAFLADHKTIAIANDESIEMFDTKSGSKIGKLSSGNVASINSLSISPDGKSIFLNSGKSIKKWDLTSDQGFTSLEDFRSGVKTWKASPDGDIDLLIRNGNLNPFSDLAVSPNNKIVAAIHNFYQAKGEGGFNIINTLVLWDSNSGNIIKALRVKNSSDEVYPSEARSLIFSPDGRKLAILQSLRVLQLLDLYSGKVAEIPLSEGSTEIADPVNTMAFSPDGNLLGYGDGWGLGVVDVTKGEKKPGFDPFETQSELEGPEGQVISVVFSPDGTLIGAAFSEKDSPIRVGDETDVSSITYWNLSTREEVKFPARPEWAKFSYKVDKTATMSGKEIRVIVDRNKIKLFNPETKQTVATLISGDRNDWLLMTPDGFFDGTPDTWKQLIWRFNSNIFDYGAVELYFNDFFYPGLLKNLMAAKVPKSKPGKELEKIDRRQPKVEIISVGGQLKGQLTNSALVTDNHTAIITVEVTDNIAVKKQPEHGITSGARDLRLFRNGSLVKVWHGDIFEKPVGCETVATMPSEPRRVRCNTNIAVVTGANNFTSYAFNSNNVKSNDAAAAIDSNAAKRDGTLYVLAVGVDKYAASVKTAGGRDYDLNYAVADINAIGQKLTERQAALKQKQYTETKVISLKNDNATKDNVLLALNRLAKDGDKKQIPAAATQSVREEIAKIKPLEPEDGLIIYYAGHGTARCVTDEQSRRTDCDRFYLIPTDGFPSEQFADEKDRKASLYAHSISDEELSTALETVDAGKMVMVIDACNSGAIEGEEKRRGPMNSRGLAQLAYEKGMDILTASQSLQSAQEGLKIKDKQGNVIQMEHGLLTYALLLAFTDKEANKDNDDKLTESEWLSYAAARVPQLQLEAMKYRSAENRGAGDETKKRAEIVFTNGDDRNLPPEKRRLQTPRLFTRRETDPSPLIIGGR